MQSHENQVGEWKLRQEHTNHEEGGRRWERGRGEEEVSQPNLGLELAAKSVEKGRSAGEERDGDEVEIVGFEVDEFDGELARVAFRSVEFSCV
jgi:hypothetical protein